MFLIYFRIVGTQDPLVVDKYGQRILIQDYLELLFLGLLGAVYR